MSTNPKSDNKGGKEKKTRKPRTKKKVTVADMVSVEKPTTENKEQRDVRLKEAYVDFLRWTILTKQEIKQENAPKTQKEFAVKWGIHEDTISDWRKRDDFEKLREDIFRKKLASEVPEVMADLRKRIKKYGMGMDVELWLAYSKGWDRKRVVEIKDPVTFGDGDIRNLIGKLPPEKQKLFRTTLAKLLAEAEALNDTL